ncbi:MAG: hypothetical protein GF346_07825 [Candidatus Eisenbacteria bacterium]|nr:hypothetical protein [Candidatus Latescibacterota bacterium]MBD3302341.1 hypothetical protein [Candidatus Eisenbacteria bacterium]
MGSRLDLKTRIMVVCVGIALGSSAIWIATCYLLGHEGPPGLANLLIALPATLLAASLVAHLLERRLRRSTDRLVETVRHWGRTGIDRSERPALSGEFGRITTELQTAVEALIARVSAIDRDTRERIHRTEELATIGHLAAGIAHEINNPLGGILLYGNLLVETTDADDPRRANMEKIVAQATRAQRIVQGLLDFSRQSPATKERVDLNRVVSGVLELMESHPRLQNVRIRREADPDPLLVDIDVSKIQQVLVNVIVNALEAMESGGNLTIRSGGSERKGYCRVAVTDTGPGIAPEHLSRLFEPFFTTKEVGRGIGLGLAISYGIVQDHGGDIEVQSGPGGTTFRILLPAAEGTV